MILEVNTRLMNKDSLEITYINVKVFSIAIVVFIAIFTQNIVFFTSICFIIYSYIEFQFFGYIISFNYSSYNEWCTNMNETNQWVAEWIDALIDEWIDECIEGWVNGWVDG